jgi:hypothetical protein
MTSGSYRIGDPYLHDGGVAVGPDPGRQLGMAGTVAAGIRPDPAESLRALVDRSLRERVVAANHADASIKDMHVQGIGHEYWADGSNGFSREDQDALIHYLLTVQPGAR